MRRGPNGERMGDPVEGEDLRELPRSVSLIVVGVDGVERPGYVLRAGDFVTETHYDHDRRLMTATVGERPLTWRLRLRRWWEGLR